MIGYKKPKNYVKNPGRVRLGKRAVGHRLYPHQPVTKATGTHPRVHDPKTPRTPNRTVTMSVHDVLKKHL